MATAGPTSGSSGGGDGGDGNWNPRWMKEDPEDLEVSFNQVYVGVESTTINVRPLG